VKAVPAEGYVFVKWDDDETSAERSLTIADDVSLVATFKKESTGGSGTGGSGEEPDLPTVGGGDGNDNPGGGGSGGDSFEE